MCKFLAGMGENEAAVRAAARNHTSWMAAQAEPGGGGPREHGALRWIVSGPGGGASLPFPDAVAPADADARCARIDDDRVRVGAGGPVRDSWRATAAGGQAIVHLAGGEAGLYDVGVEPGVQRTGLGRALTVAALRAARHRGATVATVNATQDGERLYRSVGARSHGHGQTFWIHRGGLAATPSATLVAAAEAAGRGEVPAGAPPEVLAARLPGNGMGLAHVALQAGHPDAARDLAARGAPLDAILAYELDGADGLLNVALDEPVGRLGGTVLHEAVRLRDAALLQAALALGADPTVLDGTYGATPLDWARHLRFREAEALLLRR